jgi:hypothetical protein
MPLLSLTAAHIPFLTHLLLELPASINFYLAPSEQLSSPAPQAHALIRQYAVLLASSNLVALTFLLREIDGTSKAVAGALGVYHIAPLVRAIGRLRESDSRGRKYGSRFGGPTLHAIVHGFAFLGLELLFLGEFTEWLGRKW